MTAAEQRQTLSHYFENDGVTVGAASSVTFNMGSGTDTATNRYLNLQDGIAYGLNMICTVACSITKINSKTLKVPMSVGTGGWVEPNCRIINFTVTAGAATDVEVEAKA
jgi:hypothetical protein